MGIGVALHDVGCHHGREHAGHHQRGKHRQRRRPAKLLEELARNAAHEGRGQKHRNQCEGGGNHGQPDFVCRLHRGLERGFAHAQVALDVFHLHDGIIHQNADHQRQRQQRHHVDGKAQVMHADEGRNGRQRQRHRRHEGGPPVAQKQPHHDHGQDGPLVQQGHRAVELLLHRGDEVEGLGQLHVGVNRLEVGQGGPHGSAHFHLARTPAAGHFKADHGLAVKQGGGTRLGHGVGDGGYLVEPDALGWHVGVAPAHRQFDARQLLRRSHSGQGAQRLLTAAQVGPAAGRLQLHLLQLAAHIGGGDAQRQHALRVQLHGHLPVGPAHAGDRAHATHRQQPFGDGVVHKPAQGLVVHAGHAHRVGQHRLGGQIHFLDDGVAHIGGQVAAHALHGAAHIVHRLLHGFFEAEFGGDGHRAVLHLGVDVFQPLQGGHGVFKLAGHLGFQLGRGRTGQRGHHGDGGQVEVGKVLHLHGFEAEQAREGEHDKQHQRRNRVADGPGGDIHTGYSQNMSWLRFFNKRKWHF